jgi:cytosine/adenosine deaminase-related metal-dependent hydrolase
LIETGKVADLILLDANPLDNIRHTQQIRAVIINGKLLDRAVLDRLLAQAEATRKTTRVAAIVAARLFRLRLN